MKGKNKRKQRPINKHEEEVETRSSKSFRIEPAPEPVPPVDKVNEEAFEYPVEGSSPWRNLQLILSLQSKNLPSKKKVELAYDYVKLRVAKEADGASDMVSNSRLIVFLNNWVQSLLINSEKEIRVEEHKAPSEDSGSCLDCRCWEIFKFCLEEALRLHVSLSFSRDILRVIQCLAKTMLGQLDVASSHQEVGDLNYDHFKWYKTVLDCISYVFTSHGGVSKDNLDLWILAVAAVLGLVKKVSIGNLRDSKASAFVLDLSCLVLEPFAKFLRVHPVKKNGFSDFIDQLLEPLLCLLDVLHPRVQGSNLGSVTLLRKLVDEVLSQGLFHPSNVDGFLSLQSLAKYKMTDDTKPSDSSATIKSYHRHLFDKLCKIVARKTAALGGVGELLRVYVNCIGKQNDVSGHEGFSRNLKDDLSDDLLTRSSGASIAASEKSRYSTLGPEIRKSLFEFFVQITEPLIYELDSYLQADLETGTLLLDLQYTLKSTNAILNNFIQANVYIRAEDTSEGACLNFLKVIYNKMTSFSARINQLLPSTFGFDGRPHKEALNLVAKELVVATRYLVEIEYDVIENDLENLWLMMFSYGPLGISLTEFSDQSELVSEVLHFGCHLFNLYSDLRQVNASAFALCKAVRCLVSSISNGELCHSESMSCEASFYYESWAKSLRIVLCSTEIKGSIHNAIKSIPEGQVSGCVRELTDDISESLEWMKESTSSACFDLKVEILGRGLSEVYTLILDSLTVTTGNSCLVGVSLKGLMAVIRPSMTSLVTLLPDGAYEFLSTITGRPFNKESGCESDLNSAHWVFLFYLRLYMSYRSLYRQAISLTSPDTAKKMSNVVYDPFAACSGKDWLETTEGIDEGYFSWVVQPSASLLVVTKTISDICFHDMDDADCSPLIYVLVTMALQRLADLNRLIKSFEYLLKRNDNLTSTIPTDDAEIKIYRKESKKRKKNISDLRQEAEGLTNFMMGYFPLITEVQLSVSSSDIARDTVVGAMNRKSLPMAFWFIMCHNIDIWSSHATKKKMKTFLSVLFQTSFSSSSCTDFKNHDADKLGHPKTVTPHQISSELLSDTVLYEQKFVRRHMASRFCRFLEESASPLFSKNGKVDLSSPPNWPEVLSALESSSFVVSGKANAANDCSSGVHCKQPMKHCSQQEITVLNTKKYTVAMDLLNFLCWIPKGCLTSKSFSLYATCIFNLERLVIDSLLDCHDPLQSHDGYELLRLFLSCRRALKHLVVAFLEGNAEVSPSSLPPILFESSFPALWLLKSLCALSDLQRIFPEESVNQVKDMMFSLMDYTSHVFLVLSKAQFMPAIHSLISAGKSGAQKVTSSLCHEQNRTDFKPSSYSSEVIDVWNSVVHVAETLKQQAQFLFVPIKEAICSQSLEYCTVHESKKLLSTISCLEGYFRGLSSAYDNVDVESSKLKKNIWRRKFEPIYKINLCVDTFGDIILSLLYELSYEGGKLPQSVSSVQGSSATDYTDNPSTVNSCTDFVDDKHYKKKRFQPEKADVDSIMTMIDSTEQEYESNPILRSLLSGENHEGAFLLRELFIAASTMLKLNLQIISTSLLSSLGPTFFKTAQVLFLEFAEQIETPSPFSFVLLDGIAKYLQEMWNHFLSTNPNLPERFYAKFIDLHLIAIGKCIYIQGKEATLASRAAESSTKTLNIHRGLSATCNYRTLDEFKGRLRMAFTVFLRASSALHISCAIHHLVSVLVAEGCTNYQLSSDGGKVSSTVAACIDCLDLLLEFATERKCLSDEVKEQIQKFVSCLFNVILRLQSPRIFSANLMNTKGKPDPGSVILMCVEVLIRITRKPAGYQMDSCFVQQGLRIPAALFRNIFHLRIPSDSESLNMCIVDRKFTIDLYDACCRLLGSLLGHHAREIRPCLALLEDSVSVLLSCLEVVDINLAVQKGFVWELPEAVKCASFLRRIYEEIRHQCLKKEVFLSRHCSQLLSNYIWIYSGFGPHKSGIKREIDEALRPGVYALVDSCSEDDFQYMHTVFGEGPCRTHLANLRHDYEINFKYQGKV